MTEDQETHHKDVDYVEPVQPDQVETIPFGSLTKSVVKYLKDSDFVFDEFGVARFEFAHRGTVQITTSIGKEHFKLQFIISKDASILDLECKTLDDIKAALDKIARGLYRTEILLALVGLEIKTAKPGCGCPLCQALKMLDELEQLLRPEEDLLSRLERVRDQRAATTVRRHPTSLAEIMDSVIAQRNSRRPSKAGLESLLAYLENQAQPVRRPERVMDIESSLRELLEQTFGPGVDIQLIEVPSL